MKSKFVVLLLALAMGCGATNERPLDPCEKWEVANVSGTTVNHISLLGSGEKSVHEIPVNSIHNYFLFRQFEIQEHRLVSYLLARYEVLPESVFEGSPKVSMMCAIVAADGSKTVKHLTLQFIGRRIARVLNSSPDLRLDRNNLVVIGQYNYPLEVSRIYSKSREADDYLVACERFSDFKRRLMEDSDGS